MMSNNIYYHGRRGCLRATSFSTAQICHPRSRVNNSRKPPTPNPTPGTRLPRKGSLPVSPPQPTGVPHTSHLSKRCPRLCRWVQVRPGMRRKSSTAEFASPRGPWERRPGGSQDARSPSPVASPVPPAAGLHNLSLPP